MCNPMTMALAGVASAHAENKAADAAYNWRRRMEELGTSNAVLANAAKQRQLGTQTQQKLRSVGDEIRMIARKGNQAAATAAVRATKGGLAADSGSVERLQAQFGRDALESIGVRELEGAGTRTFSQQQAEAIELETQARINSVQAGPAPSKFGQFTNLVIGGVSGYMDGMEPSSGIVPGASAAVPDMTAARTGAGFSGSSSVWGRTMPVGFNPLGSGYGVPGVASSAGAGFPRPSSVLGRSLYSLSPGYGRTVGAGSSSVWGRSLYSLWGANPLAIPTYDHFSTGITTPRY